MEEPAPLTGIRRRAAAVLAGLVLALGGAEAGRADEAELSRALGALGAPSALWGRLAVEEESPEGPSTPLTGVAVTLYPYTAGLGADLERIRGGARASGRDYDTAIARLQERLSAHATQVAALTGAPLPAPTRSEAQPPPARQDRTGTRGAGLFSGRPAPAERNADPAPAGAATGEGDATPSSATGLIRRGTTDSSGLFLFSALPAGDWLLVAIQTSPYSAPRRPPPSSRASSTTGTLRDGFLERERPQAKAAEVWVVRVRVSSDQPARLLLTDRARFMVGPIR
jgi:hypothetical protein